MGLEHPVDPDDPLSEAEPGHGPERHGSPVVRPGLVITRIDKDGVSAALDKYLSGIGVTGHRRKALAGELWAAITRELEAGGVLLSVSAKKPGTSWLHAGKVKQQVAVTEPLVFDVTFKFLHHLDADGNLVSPTDKKPSDVDDWIADLNWILGGQTNVWFEKAKAEPAKVNRVLGQPVGDAVLRNDLAPQKDGTADVTVFLVGKWKGKTGGDPAGSSFQSERDRSGRQARHPDGSGQRPLHGRPGPRTRPLCAPPPRLRVVSRPRSTCVVERPRGVERDRAGPPVEDVEQEVNP